MYFSNISWQWANLVGRRWTFSWRQGESGWPVVPWWQLSSNIGRSLMVLSRDSRRGWAVSFWRERRVFGVFGRKDFWFSSHTIGNILVVTTSGRLKTVSTYITWNLFKHTLTGEWFREPQLLDNNDLVRIVYSAFFLALELKNRVWVRSSKLKKSPWISP